MSMRTWKPGHLFSYVFYVLLQKPGIWPITSTKDPTHLSPFRMFKQTLLASQESAIAGSPTVHL